MCWLGNALITVFQKNRASLGHDAIELIPIKPKPLNLKLALNRRYIVQNFKTDDSLGQKYRGVV